MSFSHPWRERVSRIVRFIIRCDKIEVVRGNRGSAPEIECFGDVMVTDSTLSIQAERVQKRGKTFVFEGSSGKPVQIIKKSGDKAVSRITAEEVTARSALESSVLCACRGCPSKDTRDSFQPQVDCFFPLFRPRPSLEDEGFRFALLLSGQGFFSSRMTIRMKSQTGHLEGH